MVRHSGEKLGKPPLKIQTHSKGYFCFGTVSCTAFAECSGTPTYWWGHIKGAEAAYKSESIILKIPDLTQVA